MFIARANAATNAATNAPKLIDPARKGVPLQPEREGRVRCNAWRLWTHCSIEEWHQLSDGITRKDGHGKVSITPRPTTSGDPVPTHFQISHHRTSNRSSALWTNG